MVQHSILLEILFVVWKQKQHTYLKCCHVGSGNNSSMELSVVVPKGGSVNNSNVLEPPKSLPLQKPKRRMLPKTPVRY